MLTVQDTKVFVFHFFSSTPVVEEKTMTKFQKTYVWDNSSYTWTFCILRRQQFTGLFSILLCHIPFIFIK